MTTMPKNTPGLNMQPRVEEVTRIEISGGWPTSSTRDEFKLYRMRTTTRPQILRVRIRRLQLYNGQPGPMKGHTIRILTIGIQLSDDLNAVMERARANAWRWAAAKGHDVIEQDELIKCIEHLNERNERGKDNG